MTRSMTGFGSAVGDLADMRVNVTARSVNHRYLDVSVHVPRSLQPLEAEVKKLVKSRLARGRVEVFVRAEPTDPTEVSVRPVPAVISALVAALRDAKRDHELVGDVGVSDIARFPGAFVVGEPLETMDDEQAREVMHVVTEAVDALAGMREAEGARLEQELLAAVDAIESRGQEIATLSEAERDERRQRLLEKAGSLLEDLGLDDARLYQEMARLVEKHDVNEELARLRSHVTECRDSLGSQKPLGKTLDFLAQELNREANTIGSKAASARLIAAVVQLKSEIERFREQVQNVE